MLHFFYGFRLSNLLTENGVAQVMAFAAMVFLPKSLRKQSPFVKKNIALFRDSFTWFESEYNEHEKTYDPDNLRDFIDV
jgi:hypothetical protein